MVEVRQEDDPPCTDCGDTGIAGQTEKPCTCEAGINLDWEDDTDCANCGGEGFTYGCSWDWQCDTWDGDSCLCTRRCEWCQPSRRDPMLGKVLSDAIAAGQHRKENAGE